MATINDYNTRVSPVVVHILDGDEIKIRHFDSMVSIDTDMTLELRGQKKYMEIEANTLEEAYSKLITHLTERAVKSEEKVKELKKEIAQLRTELDEPEKEDLTLEQTMLTSLREIHGWSRKDIATELGVSSEYVRLLERGDRTPSHPVAYKIRKIHG